MGILSCMPLRAFLILAAIIVIIYVAYNAYKKNSFVGALISMLCFVLVWMSVINLGCDLGGPGSDVGKICGWSCAIIGMLCVLSCATGKTESVIVAPTVGSV